MTTLEQTLDSFNELSIDEQNLLSEIIFKMSIESKREKIAAEAKESLREYHAGTYSPISVKEAIDILHLGLKEG